MNELSPQTRQLLERASGVDDPDAGASQRVERSLSRRLALGTGLALGGATVAKSATGAGLLALGAKSAAGALVVGALAFSGYELLAPVDDSAPAHSALSHSALSHSALSHTARNQPSHGHKDEARVRAPAPPPVEPEAASEDPEVSTADDSETRPPTELPTKAPRSRPSQVSPDEATSQVSKSAEDALMTETAALKRAQRAMRSGDPNAAIQLLSEQDARYRSGALQQERSAARVLALCQAGRVSEARARAVAFQRKWPRSPLTAKVVSACADQ